MMIISLDAAGTTRAFPDGVSDGLQTVTNQTDNAANNPRDKDDESDDFPAVTDAYSGAVDGVEGSGIVGKTAERTIGDTPAADRVVSGVDNRVNSQSFRLSISLQIEQLTP